MKKLTTILFISITALGAGACKGKSPADECEAIYKKGNGEKPYATDKAKFMDVCTKSSDQARKCLQESGKDRFNDKDCGPDGKSFDEQMAIMKQGQGTP